MARNRAVFSAVTVAILFTFLRAPAIAAGTSNSQLRIAQDVRSVWRTKKINAKVDATKRLRGLVLATPSSEVDDQTIHSIASLLQIKNEAIRYWVAEALGHFGQRAKFAAPELIAIVNERECMIEQTSSLPRIRDTLAKIGSPVPERKCDHYIRPTK